LTEAAALPNIPYRLGPSRFFPALIQGVTDRTLPGNFFAVGNIACRKRPGRRDEDNARYAKGNSI